MRHIWLGSAAIAAMLSVITELPALPPSSPVTDEVVASAAGYPGSLQVQPIAEPVSMPGDIVIWAVRVSADDGSFPTLEISLTEGAHRGSQLDHFKAIAASQAADSLNAVEAFDPDMAKAMRALTPRLLVFDPGRTGVVFGLPGMAGTGFAAIVPRPEVGRFLVVSTVLGVEQVTLGSGTAEFRRRFLDDPGAMLERIARVVDQLLGDAPQSQGLT